MDSKELEQAIEKQRVFLSQLGSGANVLSEYFGLRFQELSIIITEVNQDQTEFYRGQMALLLELKEEFKPGG